MPMRKTGFQKLLLDEKTARLALQISSRQKVSIQDLVLCSSLLNRNDPGTVNAEKAKRKIYERNSRLLKPQGSYLNSWDNHGLKSKKHCEIMLPQKVINKQERSYSEMVKNSPRVKVVLKPMIDESGKTSLYPIVTDLQASNKAVRSSSCNHESRPSTERREFSVGNDKRLRCGNDAERYSIQIENVDAKDIRTEESKVTRNCVPVSAQTRRAESQNKTERNTVFAPGLEISNDSSILDGSIHHEDSIIEKKTLQARRQRSVGFQALKPKETTTGQEEKLNLPVLRNIMIGKLEPLDVLNLRTSQYLKYLNDNSKLMHRRFKEVLEEKRGVNKSFQGITKEPLTDRRITSNRLVPNLLKPDMPKYLKPQPNPEEGEFEERLIAMESDMVKVEQDAKYFQDFYGTSRCVYPKKEPKPTDESTICYDPFSLSFKNTTCTMGTGLFWPMTTTFAASK